MGAHVRIDITNHMLVLGTSVKSRAVSPCINECRLSKGICEGCKRTQEEIEQWRDMSKQQKLKIIQRLNNLKR